MKSLFLLDIEGGIRSFFASLAASLSFDLIFIIGIAIELVLILFFVIRSRFSYEIRTTKCLDKLNKWLFVNKKLGTENIKEFTNMMKKGPKRLSYNWQQYILYREKAPSEYLSVENCIEKPLKASSLNSSIRAFSVFSIILSIIVFVVGIAHNNAGDTVLNASMVIVAMIVPMIILLLWGIAVTALNARKNTNLDELYQNHHLFQRFIDNACVDLPAFIDFSLLFTTEEIEKGIPALREYLENRARKEKEEFDRAKSEMVEYEKYDFEKAGVDGSNILERAMNESEAYLNNKSKTLAKISQFEASLESLKRNFDNIQKDYQKKIQTSKENIDRLRQQQEETTSRIESNFLRKQQATEIAKQEKEEADFEQQKRRYLVEKNDYEEEIKNLNVELDSGRADVERAMLSEYQTFYKRICQSAAENVDQNIKDELASLKEKRDESEEELAETQTILKRLQDENATLRKKMNLEPNDSLTRLTSAPEEEKKAEPARTENKPITETKPIVSEFVFEDKPQVFEESLDTLTVKEEKPAQNILDSDVKPVVEEYVFEDTQKAGDFAEPEEYTEFVETPVKENEQEEIEETLEDEAEEVKTEEVIETPVASDIKTEQKKRGRPVGSTKPKPVSEEPKRGRGRPRKVVTTPVSTEPKKRGRPVGSTKKVNSPSVKKRAQAAKQLAASKRSKSGKSMEAVNNQIDREQKKLESAQNEVNNQLSETLKDLNESLRIENERKRLIQEIETLRNSVASANENTPVEEVEAISQKIESLLEQIQNLEG